MATPAPAQPVEQAGEAVREAPCLWEIDSALKDDGIEIQFPQGDPNVRSLFGLSGNDARMDTEQQIEEDAARAAADEQVRNAPKQD